MPQYDVGNTQDPYHLPGTAPSGTGGGVGTGQIYDVGNTQDPYHLPSVAPPTIVQPVILFYNYLFSAVSVNTRNQSSLLLALSTQNVYVPLLTCVDALSGIIADATQFASQIAIVTTSPVSGDWHTATWLHYTGPSSSGDAILFSALTVGPSGTLQLIAGQYNVYINTNNYVQQVGTLTVI